MSSGRVWASPPSNICNLISSSSKAQTRKRWSFPVIIHRLPTEHNRRLCSSDLNLNNSIKFAVTTTPLHTSSFRCNSSSIPGGPGPGPGESDSRSVLDAFFLGKALAEAVNERIESAVGEFLSTVGRLQAEQQKQVQDFQEEVLERAKRAKEKAAREAMEAQGFIPKPSTENVSVNGDGDSTTSITPATNTPAIPTSSYNSNASDVNTDPGPSEEDPIFGVPIED